MKTKLKKVLPWLLIIGGFYGLSFLPKMSGLAFIVLGIVILIERRWPFLATSIIKTKLFVAIVSIILGLLFYLGGSQYIGAALITIGIFSADLYAEEKKKTRKRYVQK